MDKKQTPLSTREQTKQNKDMKLYHVGLSRNLMKDTKIAILPGDPGRVENLAKRLDKDAYFLANNREYTSWLAHVDSVPVLVVSTGMGGPSVGIGLEELAMLGVKNFIRIGTCGSIQENVGIGSVVLNTGAVRNDGTSDHFAPIQYPAVSDFFINRELVGSAEKLNIKLDIGIVNTSATFWQGQERYDGYSGRVPSKFRGYVDELRSINVLNMEMECATLFTWCQVNRLRSSSLCAVIAHRTKFETIDKSKYEQQMTDIMQIIKASVPRIIKLGSDTCKG